MAVICRINGSDDILGGQTPQDAAAVAAYLEKECGVDGLHVSRAVHLHDEYMWALYGAAICLKENRLPVC